MAAQRKRWICPGCKDGKLAPSRMSNHDVRRVCLPCSEKALKAAKGGKALLVFRTCPALDKQRKAKAEKRSEQGKTDRSKASVHKNSRKAAQDAAYQIGSFDLRDEMVEIIKLTFLKKKGCTVSRTAKRITLTMRTTRGQDRGTSGYAYLGTPNRPGSVQVNRTGTGGVKEAASAWSVLSHEILHSVGYKHGPHMMWAQVQLAKERWGLDVSTHSSFKGDHHGAVPIGWLISRLLQKNPEFIQFVGTVD